jgi:type IV secretory pathway VirB2 component (pilin)
MPQPTLDISNRMCNLLVILTAAANEGAIAAASKWVSVGLLGPAATSIAILAIASLGLAMLWGRFDLRLAGRTIVGLFILFGAPLIAYELMQTLDVRETAIPDVAQAAAAPQPPAIPTNAPVNDPYAGAAVPQLQ